MGKLFDFSNKSKRDKSVNEDSFQDGEQLNQVNGGLKVDEEKKLEKTEDFTSSTDDRLYDNGDMKEFIKNYDEKRAKIKDSIKVPNISNVDTIHEKSSQSKNQDDPYGIFSVDDAQDSSSLDLANSYNIYNEEDTTDLSKTDEINIMGKKLPEDVTDEHGNVIARQGMEITKDLVDKIKEIDENLYEKLLKSL